ncbi:two-component system response regulator ArcA [Catenovulum sp. SX2]|uniref:two-component system response regulator ArcA n=1 Tax=Catenovulum TaxID=1172191 RepID=UPI00037F9F84|nr:two-component system response regulator ArcA [Catenovulum agarivorans]
MQTHNILIVEDEAVTRNTLTSLFEAEGYNVFSAENGEEMHTVLKTTDINLVVMDINLPGKNGLMLARELRENKNMGLIFLTGRDNDVDRILGLEIGADDYLVKPFNPRELTIRARNLMNRTKTAPVESTESVTEYRFNGWVLDCDSRSLVSPSEEAIRLPKSEYRALKLLLDNPGKILTREQLIKEMTGRELKPNDRTVDVTIRRLRKHFEEIPDTPEIISTIHGEGYRFCGEVEA